MVMETSSHPPSSEDNTETQPTQATAPVNSRKRILEKATYDDLGAPDAKKPAALNLSRLERYLTGPTPAASQVHPILLTNSAHT